MQRYCTLFDCHYLPRGMALHRSLLRHGGDFVLHVLCLDVATLEALARLELPHVELIPINTLERWDPELRSARESRTPPEFYFTCKPVLLHYLFEHCADFERLSYLDSDLYFFSDAVAVEKECGDAAVALTPHRFSEQNARRRIYGEFNAGWVSIRRSAPALQFIRWWRLRCHEWCRMVAEETRFGDQKYLDQVPTLFPGTKVVSHPGMNLGPWNLDPGRVEWSAGRVSVAGRPLIFYHFHAIRRLLFNLYDCGLYEYGVAMSRDVRDGIYRPYFVDLADCTRLASRQPSAKRATTGALDAMRQLRQTLRVLARHDAIFAS